MKYTRRYEPRFIAHVECKTENRTVTGISERFGICGESWGHGVVVALSKLGERRIDSVNTAVGAGRRHRMERAQRDERRQNTAVNLFLVL